MKKAKKSRAKAKARVQPIPKGYHDVTPYLSVQGAAQATGAAAYRSRCRQRP